MQQERSDLDITETVVLKKFDAVTGRLIETVVSENGKIVRIMNEGEDTPNGTD